MTTETDDITVTVEDNSITVEEKPTDTGNDSGVPIETLSVSVADTDDSPINADGFPKFRYFIDILCGRLDDHERVKHRVVVNASSARGAMAIAMMRNKFGNMIGVSVKNREPLDNLDFIRYREYPRYTETPNETQSFRGPRRSRHSYTPTSSDYHNGHNNASPLNAPYRMGGYGGPPPPTQAATTGVITGKKGKRKKDKSKSDDSKKGAKAAIHPLDKHDSHIVVAPKYKELVDIVRTGEVSPEVSDSVAQGGSHDRS